MNEIEEGFKLDLQFEKRGGLLPVVVQEVSTGEILMVASVNQEAFNNTIETSKATFWSTSRNKLWVKGETSGIFLEVENIMVDCDQDAVIYQVNMNGEGACHTHDENGVHRKGCFYRSYDLEKEELKKI